MKLHNTQPVDRVEEKRVNPFITIAEIRQTFGIGDRLARRYARESGAVLPRIKGAEYKIRREQFLSWMERGTQNED